MEDVYKDYDTLGHIFGVSDVAEQRVQAMKNTEEYNRRSKEYTW